MSRKLKYQTLRICRQVQADYAGDPVGWVKRYISFDGLPLAGPTEQQEEILRALAKHRFVAVSGGGGLGKTATAVWACLWGLTAHEQAMIGVTGPVGPQLSAVFWPEIDVWLSRCSLHQVLRYTKNKVAVKGWEKWAIFKRTIPKEDTDISNTMAGFHGPWIMFVVDEAAGVKDPVFTAIDGAMTQPNSHALLISNPTSSGGYYYDTITDPSGKGYHVLKYSSLTSPLVTKEYEERIIARWGKDSPMYRIKVLGEPVGSTDSVVVDPYTYDRVVAEQRSTMEGSVIVSVDVAGEGPDGTRMAVRSGNSWVDWVTIPYSDPIEAADQIQTYVERNWSGRPVIVIVDKVGIGFGLWKVLDRRPLRVVGVEGSAKADNADMFENRRTELYWHLHKNFPTYHFPATPPERLRKELANLRFEFDADRVRLTPKKKFISMMGFSPDWADCMAMAETVSGFTWAVKPVRTIPSRVMPQTMVMANDKGGEYGHFL